MNVDFTYTELKYIASEAGTQSWQSGIADSIEKKCRLAMPLAKEQEDATEKATRIASLKRELAALERKDP